MNRIAPCVLLALAPLAGAQSFNIDFGSPSSGPGQPAAGYGAVGLPGIWNAVGAGGAGALDDVSGSPTPVALTITASTGLTEVECDHALSVGDDEALLDDRLEYPPVPHSSVGVKLSNLEPGYYRVVLYSIDGGQVGCEPDSLFINVDSVFGTQHLGWTGSFQEQESHSVFFAERPAGGDLVMSVEGNSYGTVWMSGMQVERLDGIEPFCFGFASNCPCLNGGTPGTGCGNSTGQGGAWIGASGTTSVAADDLSILGGGFVPGAPALLFAGTNAVNDGDGIPFGDGLRCAGGTVSRLGVRVPDGSGAATWGPGLAGHGGFAPGFVHYQGWYRDGGSPCGNAFNTSQGLRVFYLP